MTNRKKHKKLMCFEVLEIKALLKIGKLTHKQIGEQYGVCGTAITHINTGKYWSDIQDIDHTKYVDIVGYKNYLITSDVEDINRIIYSKITGKYSTPTFGGRYYQVKLSTDTNNGKTVTLHRILADTFITNDDPINKTHVNHKNGIKTDNRIENLEHCTPSHNSQHAHDNGLIKSPKGENHHNSFFMEADILEIREMYDTGNYTHDQIAEIKNTNRRNIGNIVNRKTWKHI